MNALRRRDFVGAAAASAAVALLRSRLAAAPARGLRKAIMYSTIGVKGTTLEKFTAMKAAGFEGIEPMGGMNREEVVAAFKTTGLGAASVCCHTHWVKPLSAPDEATRRIGLEGLLHSLHDAHAYGAGSVLLVPGVARNGVTYQQCWDRSIAEIRRAIPVARDLGVRIAIENVGNDFILNPRQAADYLDAIGSEWVGWHFDIGNAGRYGPAQDWITTLGRRILRIHVKDFTSKPPPSGARAAERPRLLDGETDWPAVMRALDTAGYSGWAITEQPGPQTADLAAARDMTARLDRIFAL
jgi:hexulose-6-phosphate isomerase